jgi:glucose/arabinose dehydrogenase
VETPPPLAIAALSLTLDSVTDGLDAPLYLTHAGDGSGRRFVVEQGGRIRILDADDTVAPSPFLEIADRITSGGERGLLGLAFHPDFGAGSDRFFVYYTDLNGNEVLSEFRLGLDADAADPDSERILLTIQDFAGNHNGGWIGFGPGDGLLYIATGDGGGGGDPQGTGQRLDTRLAKILRIDVDGGEPYGIPEGNPFAAGTRGELPEIWSYGLRNPWRASFDRETGDFWIGDVGQGSREEINLEPSGSTGGANYGWSVMEGSICFRAESCEQEGLVLPVFDYPRDLGNIVTGGYVYRGTEFPELRGAYVFADAGTGRVWALDAAQARVNGTAEARELVTVEGAIVSFGEDEDGELYAVDLTGRVLRVGVE